MSTHPDYYMSQGGNNKHAQAKRYHGLRNQGSTCYLNSVLQVLFMTEDFREAVGRCPNDLEDPIDHQLDALFKNLKEGIGDTYEVTQKLGIDNVNEQRDAAEHMEKILTMASPEASKIFEIRLNNKTICCGDCNVETNEEKPFWNLPLPLKQSSNESYSVNDAIKDFFKDSHFSEDNQLYCEKCDGKRDATVKCVIKQHPEVLMLLLKRFEFNYYQMCFVKNTGKVDVPFIVQIPGNQTYELYAFVEHFGSLKSGHYTATIRSQDEDRWYNFNDSLVTKRSNRPFQGNKIEGSQSVHLLFYRKKGADQDNRKIGYQQFQVDNENQISSAPLLFYNTTDPLDADSCGASIPRCFKPDVGTPQREGGEEAAATTDNKGVEDKTKNRREIKARRGVEDKQSKMTGTNDDRFMSTSNKCTEHRKVSQINIDGNIKLSPDIDGQSSDSPKGLSCKQKETKRSDQRGNEGKRPEGHCTETGVKHHILSLANTNEDGLNKDVLQGEQHKFHNKDSKVQDAAGIDNLKSSHHTAKYGSAANKYKTISVERSGDEEIIKVLPDIRFNKDQQSKNYDEVRKIGNNDRLQKNISTSSHEGQEGKQEKPQNDKSFQERKMSERLFQESEGNDKTVQLDKDTQNNLQGDVQPNMNPVTQEIMAKIDTNSQNNSKTNDGETSNCILMEKQKDLVEQQIQSDEKFSTGSENTENVSESPNLTEPSTEKMAEVSPDVEIQQDGRNQSGKNKDQRRKHQNEIQTV